MYADPPKPRLACPSSIVSLHVQVDGYRALPRPPRLQPLLTPAIVTSFTPRTPRLMPLRSSQIMGHALSPSCAEATMAFMPPCPPQRPTPQNHRSYPPPLPVI